MTCVVCGGSGTGKDGMYATDVGSTVKNTEILLDSRDEYLKHSFSRVNQGYISKRCSSDHLDGEMQ